VPVVGEFHTQYWAVTDTAVAPKPGGAGRPGYPMWQSGPNIVVLGVAFGGLAPFFERFWDRLQWGWRTVGRVLRLGATQRPALLRVLDALEHPAYPPARLAVRKTATTIGFNRPEAWLDLGRAMKRDAGEAQNTYRHMESCRLLRANLLNSTVTNPQCHLIVELAYQEFAAKGR
jgi:hypothetical protein